MDQDREKQRKMFLNKASLSSPAIFSKNQIQKLYKTNKEGIFLRHFSFQEIIG